jgi:hypothetical protein
VEPSLACPVAPFAGVCPAVAPELPLLSPCPAHKLLVDGMNRIVMTRLARIDSLADGQGGLLQLETSEGPLEIRFTYEDAERLIAGLDAARARIRDDRARAALPPIAEKQKMAVSWEKAMDPVNQVAVLRAHFPDRTTQDTRIPRGEIAQIVEFLSHALRRMEPGSDMRQ